MRITYETGYGDDVEYHEVEFKEWLLLEFQKKGEDTITTRVLVNLLTNLMERSLIDSGMFQKIVEHTGLVLSNTWRFER